MLSDADVSMLAEQVRNIIIANDIDISEIIIDRLKGGESTAQEVLHAITGRIADLFADNGNLILYYSCDEDGSRDAVQVSFVGDGARRTRQAAGDVA